MLKGYLLGMEVEAGCLLVAIEWVAEDGGVQTFCVGAMYSELVGASCLGIERQAVLVHVVCRRYVLGEFGGLQFLDEFPFCDGFRAMFMTHHLARTVEEVGHQGE